MKNIFSGLDVFMFSKVRYDLIQHVLIQQKSSYRTNIAMTKTLSDVRGSTRKIYKQKGTGNARHGSNRRNQFRGGAVTFGPAKRNFTIKLNKRLTRLALLHALFFKFLNNRALIYERIKTSNSKTYSFVELYRNFLPYNVLFVDTRLDEDFILAHRNVSQKKAITATSLSVLDIVSNDVIIISYSAINFLIKNLK